MRNTKSKSADPPLEKEIRSYYHSDKERLNNPPVGLSIYDDDDIPRKSYDYDPNIDPQLYWSGKTERTSFDVPLVSLHIHETINPHQILKSARGGGIPANTRLLSLILTP